VAKPQQDIDEEVSWYDMYPAPTPAPMPTQAHSYTPSPTAYSSYVPTPSYEVPISQMTREQAEAKKYSLNQEIMELTRGKSLDTLTSSQKRRMEEIISEMKELDKVLAPQFNAVTPSAQMNAPALGTDKVDAAPVIPRVPVQDEEVSWYDMYPATKKPQDSDEEVYLRDLMPQQYTKPTLPQEPETLWSDIQYPGKTPDAVSQEAQGHSYTGSLINPFSEDETAYHVFNIAYAQTPEYMEAAFQEAVKKYPALEAIRNIDAKPDRTNLAPEMQIWAKYKERLDFINSPFAQVANAPDLEEGYRRGKYHWEKGQNSSFIYPIEGESSMTSEERKVAYYLYANDPKAFESFMEYYRPILAKRAMGSVQQMGKDIGNKAPITGSLASTGLGVVGAFGPAGALTESMITGQPYDERAEGINLLAGSIREQVKKNIGGGAGGVLYDVSTGVADIFATSGMLGPKAVSAIFSLRGAASAIESAKERGATNEQALALGIINGAVEYATEEIGMDRLFGMLSGENPVSIRRVITSALSEGLEEVPGNIIGLIADAIIMGDKAELSERRDVLMTAGYSKDEAGKEALREHVAGAAYESIVAALTGGTLAGGAYVANRTSVQSQSDTSTRFQDNTTISTTESASESPVEAPEPVDTETYTQFNQEPVQALAEPQNPFNATARFEDAEVTVSGFASVGDNATVKTTDGKNVPLSEVEFADPMMKYLYTTASAYKTTTAANTYLGLYDGSIPAPAYAEAYRMFYESGIKGAGTYDIDRSIYARMLSKDAQEAAYSAGEQVRMDMARKAWGDFPVEAKEGYSGVVKHYVGKVSDDNKVKLALIDKKARAIGMQIVVVDTLGKANSMTDSEGRVYIALDAIDGGITVAASHEFLHVAKQKDEEAYNQIKDYVLQAVGDERLIADRVKQEIDRHARAGIELSEEEAMEEIVAQAIPDIFTTEENVQALAKENPTLFQKVVEWLRELVQKWNEAFKGTPEAQALRKNVEVYERVLKIFEDTLKKSNTNETLNEGVAMSLKTEDGKKSKYEYEITLWKDGYRAWLRLDGHTHWAEYDYEGNLLRKSDPQFGHEMPEDALSELPSIIRTMHKPVVRDFYIRFGELPKSGKSMNWASETQENGVSVYDASFNPMTGLYNPYGALPGAEINYLIKGANIYLVTGEEVGRGSDGEPLLKDVKTVATLKFTEEGYKIKSLVKENATTGLDGGLRFSLKSTANANADALMQENEKLRAAVSDLKAQFQLTEGHKLDYRKIDQLAGHILKENLSKYDRKTLADDLNTVFDFIANTDGINWQEIMAATTDIAKAVLMESQQVNDDAYIASAEMRKYLRTTPISLTGTQKAEVASQFGSVANFLRRVFGSLKITNDGVPLDVAWQELNERFGEFFPADVNEGDMPAHLMDVLNSVQPTVENPFGMNIDEAAADLALRIYDAYFDIPEVKTFADKQAEKLTAVKARYRNRIDEIRKEYKGRMEAQKKRIKDAYAARDAQREETKTRAGYIDQIKRIAKKLSDRLLDNTNKSNIPEAMKKAVLQTLDALNFDTLKTKEGARQALKDLREQYAMLKDRYRDMPLAGFYDQDVYEMIDSLVEITENKSIAELTTEELGIVRDVVRTIQYMVANENRLFTEGRHQTLSDAGDWTIATLDSMRQRKEWYRMFRYVQEALQEGLLTPTMFFKQFEGTPLYDIAVRIRDGIDKHIMNVAQAEAFLRDAMERFNYRKWDLDKQYTVETQEKKRLEMNVEELLSVYVLWKREQIIGTRHFIEGGIILESNRKTRTPTIITEADYKAIEAMLTDEQRAYADYLVNFLSTTGAEWGNEASMTLYNIRKYLEKYYFPFNVSDDYTKSSPGDVQDIRLANRGFTKKIQKGAAKPLVIRPFTQVWSEHIESMSMYNALAVPLTDFERVWNYTSRESANASVKNSITRAFTRLANTYITNFIRDLHGGVISAAGTNMFDWLTAKSKRVAVAGNLSVYAQQPSAGIRATAMIDAKYFIPGTLKGTASVRRSWNEMKKYVPTAQLKEWGYFDTNMTRTIYQRAMGKPMQKIEDAFGAPAQWGDMLNWAQIWEAVKLETKANNPGLSGEDLLEAAALRTRDVLDQTQVVDSIWHRSEWQRSKGPIKIALAFMSEPIKMYNMLFDASRDFTNGNARAGVRKVSAVAKGLVLNALLRSLIVALRDRKNEKKDKDGKIIGVRTFWDKYVDAVGQGLIEAPFGLLPYIADIPSIVQGFDPGRLDASLLEKLVGAFQAVLDGKKDLKTKLLKVADPISAFSGVPITNVYRDLNAIYQTIYEAVNRDKLKGAAYDVELPLTVRLAAAVDNEPMDKNSGIYYDLLVYAKRYGTQTEFDMVKDEMKRQGRSEITIDSTFRQRMRALEPLVREGQDYLRANNVSGVQRTVNALVAQGYEENDAKRMIRTEMDYVNGKLKDIKGAKDDEEALKDIYDALAERGYTKAYLDSLPVPDGEKTEGESRATMFTYDNLAAAIVAGNKDDVQTIIGQFTKEGVPKSTIKGQVTSFFKPLYYEAHKRKDANEMKQIEKVLLENTDFYEKTYKKSDFDTWLVNSYYNEMYDLIEEGDASGAAKIRAGLFTLRGVKATDVREEIRNKYGPIYKELYLYDRERAFELRRTLVSLGFGSDEINGWARRKWD